MISDVETEFGRTLEIIQVSKNFGGIQALLNVSIRLQEGRIVGLIGPNGSGKTTLLNCISGVLRPTSGLILLDGQSIVGWGAHDVAAASILRTFQNIRLFTHLTCLDNVRVAAVAAGRLRQAASRELARALLTEFGLAHLEMRYAGTLSYGDQRRLEIARALAARPRFLLLDEPAAGMNEAESYELGGAVERVRTQRGSGVLLVEHDLGLIMRLSDYVYVLNEGKLIAEGSPETVRSDPSVIAAYIGEEDARTDEGIRP